MATTTLIKMGDSIGIVFPKEILNGDFKPGDKVSFERVGDNVLISPIGKRPTLQSLMKDYRGPVPQEIDFGEPMGKEEW